MNEQKWKKKMKKGSNETHTFYETYKYSSGLRTL